MIEMMITVLIIGILATVAVPLYRDMMTRTYAAEADSGLGTIRTEMRARLLVSANMDWSDLAARYTPGLMLKPTDIAELNLNPGDFNGRYFDHNAYRVVELTSATFTVQVLGDSSTAIEAETVRSLVRQIDEAGTISAP